MECERYQQSLTRREWESQRRDYLEVVRPFAEDRIARNNCQKKHPVYDFLFEYYSYRPAHLMRWSPGVDVRLDDITPSELDWPNAFRESAGAWWIPHTNFAPHRTWFLEWVIRYLEATGSREPAFGCLGLHEWAMVYREEQIRHQQVPLRLSRDEIHHLVDNRSLICTHFDAFRFFTPAAAPLNRIQLTRAETIEHDQPGCLHVSMDLYKWAFLIAPFSSGKLLADTFLLAIAAREMDMRASPYDLSQFGFEPIPIETRIGREQYRAMQRELYQSAIPVRERLLCEYRQLLQKVLMSTAGPTKASSKMI